MLSQRLLTLAADADIPLISPAATYPQLTALDEAGIFFRTIAPSPHQAIVLADLFADRDEGWVLIEFAGGKGLWVAQRLGPGGSRVNQVRPE